MFRGIVDFFRRLRMPSGAQLFGLFYTSRTTTSALTSFSSVVSELRGVSRHHTAQAVDKVSAAEQLHAEAAAHSEEAQSATSIADKLTNLIS